MSRVYEALRQSELDNGATHTLFDPDTFLASSTSAAAAGRSAHHGHGVGSKSSRFCRLFAKRAGS